MKKPKLIFLNHSPDLNVFQIIGLLLTSFAKNGHLIRAINGKKLLSEIDTPTGVTLEEIVEARLAKLAEYLIWDCSMVVTNYINSVEEISELNSQLVTLGYKKGVLAFYDVCFIQLREFHDEVKHKSVVQMDILNDYTAQVFSSSVVGRAYTYLTQEACLIDILALLARAEQQVSVAGKSISGKGTITEGFNETLGYKVFSCGNDVSRLLAEDKDMSIEELVASYGTNKAGRLAYDKAIDTRLFKELREGRRSVCEGRMAGYFAKKAGVKIFRIYMKVSPENAAERLFKIPPNKRKASYNFATQADAAIGIEARNREDMKAYLRTYKYNYTDMSNYHAVIDADITARDNMFPQALQKYISFLISHID